MKKISNTFRTGRTSIYTLLHYSQMISQKTFQAYTWTAEAENMDRYNISEAPTYSLGKVEVPVILYWSDRDTFASKTDVDRLQKELPNLMETHQLDFCHIDYLWGEKADTELYQPLGEKIKNYS